MVAEYNEKDSELDDDYDEEEYDELDMEEIKQELQDLQDLEVDDKEFADALDLFNMFAAQEFAQDAECIDDTSIPCMASGRIRAHSLKMTFKAIEEALHDEDELRDSNGDESGEDMLLQPVVKPQWQEDRNTVELNFIVPDPPSPAEVVLAFQ